MRSYSRAEPFVRRPSREAIMLALVGIYRDGWRRPLEAVEVWDGTHLLVTLPPDLLRGLVQYHLDGAALRARVLALVDAHRPRRREPRRLVQPRQP